MFNAKYASKLSEDYHKSQPTQEQIDEIEYQKILKLIEKEAKIGGRRICYYYGLNQNLIDKLKRADFFVEFKFAATSLEKSYHKISW